MTAKPVRPNAGLPSLQRIHDARALALAQQAERPDHGTGAQAHAARPTRIIETILAGVTTRVYDDAVLCDRMARAGQFSDRQHAAALRVIEMHDAAGFEPKLAGSYAPRGWSAGHDDDTEESAAITRFRETLGACSVAGAWLLHGLCLGEHPGVARLASLQNTLELLAKHWGIE